MTNSELSTKLNSKLSKKFTKELYQNFMRIFCCMCICTIVSCESWSRPLGVDAGFGDNIPEEATSDFKEGWHDGCDSGVAAYGNSNHKAIYGYKFDGERLLNNDYYTGWVLGFRHCRWYTGNF